MNARIEDDMGHTQRSKSPLYLLTVRWYTSSHAETQNTTEHEGKVSRRLEQHWLNLTPLFIETGYSLLIPQEEIRQTPTSESLLPGVCLFFSFGGEALAKKTSL